MRDPITPVAPPRNMLTPAAPPPPPVTVPCPDLVGPQGPEGPPGQTGAVGPQGPPGPSGAQGATGAQGDQGPVGPPGATGATGATGSPGPTGPPGAASTVPGPAGPQGPTGATGPQGPAGADSTVPGPAGPPGATGATGPQGPAGPTGATGSQGPQGNTGATGAQGPAGSTGAQGPPGQGVPTGGTTGQVLSKSSNADYATTWTTPFTQANADALYLPLTGGTGKWFIDATTFAWTPSTTGTYDIGKQAATVRDMWLGRILQMGSTQPIRWNNDAAHQISDFPASNYFEMKEWQGEVRFARADSGNYARIRGVGSTTDYIVENPSGRFGLHAKTLADLGSNSYFDGTNWQRYDTAQPSSLIELNSGATTFYSAAAATGAITFLQRMQLDVNGNLGLQAGGITMPQNQSVKWQDGNSQMMSYGRNSYFDEYNGSWSWRDTSAGSTNRMTLSAGGDLTVTRNLQVNGYINGGTQGSGTIAANVIQNGNQLQWNDGSYSICSGNWIYFRSVANGIVVQTTGGSPAAVNCGSIQLSDTNVGLIRTGNRMRVVSYDSNFEVYDASGNARYRMDGSSQCDHYGNNGSTNHRFFHHDTSWMGCQAANFTPQSDARFKKDLQDMSNNEALERVRRPISIKTWQPNWQPHRTVGFTAQDMESVVPEVVQTDTDGNMFLNYDFLTAILWGALRAMDQRLQALEGA